MTRRRAPRHALERGFSLIEVMVAMLVLVVVMFSLTYVLINSLADTAYARQRAQATNLANQTVEELRSLPWQTIEAGMNQPEGAYTDDPTYSSDSNITTGGRCFEGSSLLVAATGGLATIAGADVCTLTSSNETWQDPSCLSQTVTAPVPPATSLLSPAPISPHQACYAIGSVDYAVSVYITGPTGQTYPGSADALTATIVVTWSRPVRGGLSDHVVTTTELSSCLKGAAQCDG